MIYTNRFDRSNTLITLFVCLLLIATTFIGAGDWRIYAFVIPLNAGILFFTWALHPRHYTIEGDRIRIVRMIKSIDIPFSTLTDVAEADPELISGSIRLLGSGGLFGLYGKFSNRQLGKYLMYVTNRKKMVLLRCKDQLYVISPEDRDAFIAEVRKHLAA